MIDFLDRRSVGFLIDRTVVWALDLEGDISKHHLSEERLSLGAGLIVVASGVTGGAACAAPARLGSWELCSLSVNGRDLLR